MQVEIQLDPNCAEPRIIIVAGRMSEEIAALAERLSGAPQRLLAGFRGDTLELLDPERLLRVYASAGKTIAAADTGEYLLRLRLYEAEERLDRRRFVRISHSEIVNLRKVKQFDLSMTGTICVQLTDGTVTYASRRYMAKIKEVLGI